MKQTNNKIQTNSDNVDGEGVIVLKNIVKKFGPKVVLDNVSLSIEKGKTTVEYGNVAIYTLLKTMNEFGSSMKNVEAQVFGGAEPEDAEGARKVFLQAGPGPGQPAQGRKWQGEDGGGPLRTAGAPGAAPFATVVATVVGRFALLPSDAGDVRVEKANDRFAGGSVELEGTVELPSGQPSHFRVPRIATWE